LSPLERNLSLITGWYIAWSVTNGFLFKFYVKWRHIYAKIDSVFSLLMFS